MAPPARTSPAKQSLRALVAAHLADNRTAQGVEHDKPCRWLRLSWVHTPAADALDQDPMELKTGIEK